ncbi:DUF5134 domain-containing protein [Streptomyces zhihengii]|uniref:DUF5134 domain-containing protein n=2 Tax=Streptomyces zhihengii TaxID=1818004 RepID=A0ABS2UZP9_9ACTN|nr:DUF5134 domain-containing protein [Streptomyces zhihengii]
MVSCLATGAYCLLRMRRCRGPAREAAGGEALMGFGMAAMAVPAAVLTLPSWHWAVYAAVFGAAGARALWMLRGGGHQHHLHHLVSCLAMVYMAAAMSGPAAAGHTAHLSGTPAGPPLLTAVLLLYFAGYALHAGTRLVPVHVAGASGPGVPQAPAGGWGGRPEVAVACRLSMSLAMLAMLLAL